MRDVLSSSVAVFRVFLVILVVIGIATSLSQVPYFSNSFAFAQAEQALAFMDYVGLFMTVGFWIISVGLAALSVNNRVFMPISILFLVINVLLTAIFSDVYIILAETGFLGQASQNLPIINLIASNMPLVFGIMGLTVITALYTQIGGGRRAQR